MSRKSFVVRGITVGVRYTPWYRNHRVLACLGITLAIIVALLYATAAHSAEISDEEINSLYEYVRELEMKNAHLEKQNALYDETLKAAESSAIKVDAQTQALIALYEHKEKTMEKLMDRQEGALVRMDTLTDKLERRIASLEKQNIFWKVVGVGGIGVAAGLASK